MSEKPIFKGNLTAWNVKQIRDLIQAQLIRRIFTFVETIQGQIEAPRVESNLGMTAPIEHWGKIDDSEGHTGFRITVTNGSHEYNSHPSGLESVSVLIEMEKITLSFYSKGRLVYHVYSIHEQYPAG